MIREKLLLVLAKQIADKQAKPVSEVLMQLARQTKRKPQATWPPEIERRSTEVNHERRYLNAEIRSESIDGARYVSGYACRWNQLSEDLGGFRERLAPNCFAESLRTGDCRMLLDHDSGRLIGRASAGTLSVAEDGQGLLFRCALPNTSAGRDCYESVKRRDLTGMSFGFVCQRAEWTNEPDPDDPDSDEIYCIRTVVAATLIEISAVTWPAYSQSTVDASERTAALFPSGIPAEIRSHIDGSSIDALRLKAFARMAQLKREIESEPRRF
jgi:HK97 family phage prohead protease